MKKNVNTQILFLEFKEYFPPFLSNKKEKPVPSPAEKANGPINQNLNAYKTARMMSSPPFLFNYSPV